MEFFSSSYDKHFISISRLSGLYVEACWDPSFSGSTWYRNDNQLEISKWNKLNIIIVLKSVSHAVRPSPVAGKMPDKVIIKLYNVMMTVEILQEVLETLKINGCIPNAESA